jgi:cell division septal protein FtsQ
VSGPRLLDRGPDAPPDDRVATGPGVDPRFRERRIAVRRDAGRKRLKRLLLLVLVAVLALAAVVVLRSPVLDVDEVTVTGAVHLDAEQIRATAGIERGAPLLLADLGAAAADLEAMPWVAEAEVTRELPGLVHVEVREREAVAVVAGRGTAVLVDVTGRVLEEADPAATPFVQVLAAAAPPAPGRSIDPDLVTAVELAGRLRINPAGAVSAVRLEPSLRLELVEGGVVDLGDASDLDAKVETFRTVHARVDRSCLAVIDVTVPSHAVVTRDPGC